MPTRDNGFYVPMHDHQTHSGATASRGPTQVVYRRGGASGQIVATETITYDGNNAIATRSIVISPNAQ